MVDPDVTPWARVVADPARLDPQSLDRWRDLAESAATPNVHFDPDYLVPLLEDVLPDAGIRLVVVEEDGVWLAAMVLEPAPPHPRWPLRHGSVIGPGLSKYVALGTPLLRATALERAARALVRGLRHNAGVIGSVVELPLVDANSVTMRSVLDAATHDGAPARIWGVRRRAVARLPLTTAQRARQEMTSSRRRSIGRSLRLLEREFGEVPILEELRADDGAMAAFVRLESAGWKGDEARGGDAIALRKGAAEWLTSAAIGLAQRDRARILALKVGSHVLHLGLYFDSGGVVFAQYDAFDERYRAMGVGYLGRWLDALHLDGRRGFDLLDTCMNPDLYPDATAMYPHRLELSDVDLVVGNAPARALYRSLWGAAAVRRRLRRRS
jgi:hypothetical protein